MASFQQLLPEGYALESAEDGSALGVYEPWREAIAGTGFGPQSNGEWVESDLAGRGSMAELRLEDRRLVVRRFQRGGAMRYLQVGFGDPRRPFRELALSDRLIRMGLPTPRVAFARARPRKRRVGYDLDLATVRLEDALDLGAWLELVREGRVGSAERQQIVRAAGRLVARMHAAGLAHADLNPRNLMVEQASRQTREPRVWVIDLDKSVLRERLTESARIRNLQRLWRSVARRNARGAAFVTRTDCARFLRAHARELELSGVGGPDADEAAWQRRWRHIARGHRRTRLVHAMGWTLERLTGQGPAGRDGAARIRKSAKDDAG